LFRRYAHGLPYSDAALDAAAEGAAGTTGSFAKELIRRAVLRAAEGDREPNDEDLASELSRLMDSRQQLTRSMLGSSSDIDPRSDGDGHHATSFGWTAMP
jgi:hypothetical protein